MPIPATCPMCGSPRSQFKRSRSTGRAKCGVCGEIFEPDDEDYYGEDETGLEAPRSSGRRSGGGRGRALERVQGPAIYMIVVACLTLVAQVLFLGLIGLAAANPPPDVAGDPEFALGVTVYFIAIPIGMIVSAVVLFGALKMRQGESYGLAMTASVLTCIPCIAPCGLLGMPAGIWGLIVLMDEEVKRAFR